MRQHSLRCPLFPSTCLGFIPERSTGARQAHSSAIKIGTIGEEGKRCCKAQFIEPTMTHQMPSQDSGTPITEIPPLSPVPSSSSDLAIALRKGKRSCTNHPISHFLSYRALPFPLVKLLCSFKAFVLFQPFLQSENLPVLPKHCLTRSRRKLWKRKWRPCREMGLGNLFHCLKGKALLMIDGGGMQMGLYREGLMGP